MTLIFNKQGNFLCILSGPSKFSGAENLDEDDAEDGNIYSVYDSAKTIKWSSQNDQRVILAQNSINVARAQGDDEAVEAIKVKVFNQFKPVTELYFLKFCFNPF